MISLLMKSKIMTITETELAAARTAWGEGLVAISAAYEAGGIEQARAVASGILDDLYGFDLGPILFKPTLSGGPKTFRPSKDGTLSYFVGHDAHYPDDGGFGIKNWRQMRSTTSAIFSDGDVAMWMGWVTLTDKDGNEVTVDKSFGYKRDESGKLKIVLHHSSLPYQP